MQTYKETLLKWWHHFSGGLKRREDMYWKPAGFHFHDGLLLTQGGLASTYWVLHQGDMMERGHCTGDRVASPYLWLLCNSGMLLISLHFKLLIYLWLSAHWLQPPPALQAFRKQREGFEELAILLVRTDLHTRNHSWTGSSNTSSAIGQHGSVSLSGGG